MSILNKQQQLGPYEGTVIDEQLMQSMARLKKKKKSIKLKTNK